MIPIEELEKLPEREKMPFRNRLKNRRMKPEEMPVRIRKFYRSLTTQKGDYKNERKRKTENSQK